MSNGIGLRGTAQESAHADESAAVATEFLLNHPKAMLVFWTVVAAIAVVLTGGADWLAVFHLMSLKYTDAMGQPIGSTAALAAMSGVTLIGYVAIGAAWDWEHPAARTAAIGLYGVVLVLLALAVAPTEVSSIRDLWASLAGGGTFGAGGAGGAAVNNQDEAPVWFVWPCLAALSVAFSLFGIVFLIAKRWLGYWLSLWHCRDCALARLKHLEEAQGAADAARSRAEFIEALESPPVADAVVEAALHQGFDAYRADVNARIGEITAALADVRTPKADRQRLTALLGDAGACLKSLSITA